MASEIKPLKKILYVAMHYDYGKKEQGTSFEYNNFYPILKRMVTDVVEFDFLSILQDTGRDAMNATLLETADRVKPDLVFFVLFTEEFKIETLNELSKRFTTFNWFCDDHWRFDYFSSKYAPSFTFISTTDRAALPKYNGMGYNTALMTQWGCNHYGYIKLPDRTKKYDVSFVGQSHGSRKWLMKRLKWHGIKVDAFGRGWENGRVNQEQMIGIFNASKINLNISNASWNLHTIFRKGKEQIKGRNFEVPATGSFLLTNYVNGLENYFDLEQEMICFRSAGDLVRKIRYYLKNENEREEIARRAYDRIVREHTYEQRFKALFASMGFEL